MFHVTLPYQDPSRCHVQNIEVTWPPVRAELAINLSRCPRSPGACGYLVVACGSLFGTRLIFSRCKALLVLMGLGRLSYIGRFLAGSNPFAWRRWLDFLNARSSRSMWDGGIPRPPAGGRAPLRRFAPCVLRWKTLRVSSAPHPCGFESLRMPTKKRSRFIRAWSAMFFGAGTEGFEPPTAGTKNRSSTVELRPSMGVAKSNSSSLPNLRGHRKRHRVGVPRASGRR